MHVIVALVLFLTELCGSSPDIYISLFSDLDAGYMVADYVTAPAYSIVAALETLSTEDEHDASCECFGCVYSQRLGCKLFICGCN